MKRGTTLFFTIIALALLNSCGEKNPQNTYQGAVDSASIGLYPGLDTVTQAQFPRPQMPNGLVLDTGTDNPFAADTAYLPRPATPTDNRDLPNYDIPALQNP